MHVEEDARRPGTGRYRLGAGTQSPLEELVGALKTRSKLSSPLNLRILSIKICFKQMRNKIKIIRYLLHCSVFFQSHSSGKAQVYLTSLPTPKPPV